MSWLLIGFLVLVVPGSSWAQGSSPSCQHVAARVTSGQSQARDLALLSSCEAERGPALAAYLRLLRTAPDTTTLRLPFDYANIIHDGAVFAALKEIAADAGASTYSRVFSLRALIYQERGSTALSYAQLTGVPEGGVCLLSSLEDVRIIEGSPLPADHKGQSYALATQLSTTPGAPAEVRSAARCLQIATETRVPGAAVPLPAPTGANIRLTYLCGNKFRVRNSNLADTQVTYDVYKTPERAVLGLPGKPGVRPYSQITFITYHTGTVRLFLGNVLVQTKANGGSTCP